MSDVEKSELRRANDNPWYCLATLYGEQPPEFPWDEELAAKNRVVWNRWYAKVLSSEQRRNLAILGFPESELTPFSDEELSDVCDAFVDRRGLALRLPPDPKTEIDFADVDFQEFLFFCNFLFPVVVNFSSARFTKGVDFKSSWFARTADFNAMTLLGNLGFSSVVFADRVNFGYAVFSDAVGFHSASFLGPANFSSAKFLSLCIFNSARFAQGARFLNAEFAATAIFARAKFETRVPDFRGAKMHEATEWHGVVWPPAPKDADRAQDQVYTYERLKQEMERLKKHEDEQSFFRKELRARRVLAHRWSGEWLLNYAYEVSSNYGSSILRPVVWLFALFLCGFIFFAVDPFFNGAHMKIQEAAGLSFANIFSFLPIRREIMTDTMIKGLSNVAQIIGVIQSLLGIILLFLLSLALRSRFRMR
jgi:hypothetical protein